MRFQTEGDRGEHGGRGEEEEEEEVKSWSFLSREEDAKHFIYNTFILFQSRIFIKYARVDASFRPQQLKQLLPVLPNKQTT